MRLQNGKFKIIFSFTWYSESPEIYEEIFQSGLTEILESECSVTLPHAAKADGIGEGNNPKIGLVQKVLVVEANHW